jgi:hypothetical protein
MDDIIGKAQYYIASVFYHYKSNYGDNYDNITIENDYEQWFEEFKWKATCDYENGYDISRKYPEGEFFQYNTDLFQEVVNYINDYYQEVSGNDYILTDYSSTNVMRHYIYVYVKRNSDFFYCLCKPEKMDVNDT